MSNPPGLPLSRRWTRAEYGPNQGRPSASGSSGPPSEADYPLSPDAVDRVFPIRSVVAIDPSQQHPASAYFRGDSPSGSEKGLSRRRSLSAAEEESVRSGSIASIVNPGTSQPMATLEEPILTKRFTYQQTNEGHMVVTGISGSEQLQRCEDEPIHCPGAIQRFGAMVVLQTDPNDESLLSVRIASENSKEILGYSPTELFALSSFTRILSDEQAEGLLDHIDLARADYADLTQGGPEVFSLVITGPDALQIKLWCAVHFANIELDRLICEFELEDDILYPIQPPEEAENGPSDTLKSAPTEEELAESTTSLSRPLRTLRHARRRRGQAAAMEVFNIMSQIQEQLSSAPNLESFLKIVVGIVKEISGFHRVMIYQFDEAWNGKVVTELVDYRATKDLFKGLHFPASDIPKQARDLYKLNKVRLLYDRDQETARLVCRSTKDLETPLDMTHAYLRAMSPIHIKYLANMQVRASMSISLTAFEELWGLISCHSYGSKGMRVSFPLRKLCRLIGETASRNIERLSYASRLQARKLINTVPTEANPSGYIVASSDDLLRLFDADFGLLSIKDETKVLGALPATQEALAILEYFRVRSFTSVITSQQVSADFPDLKYAPGFNVIAGSLLVPLSTAGKDFIVFFRKAQLRHVHWAGNPYEKTLREGTEAYLEPRKSFKIWSETVVGKSREWTEEEVETAAVLCLVYGKFIEVWRQKEAALQSSQLTRLLLANASHEVRTPLNAIINYLEIALEGPLDLETRENLAKSHSASKSLIYVINDLLDLTRTEEGQGPLIKTEIFDLPATIREASELFMSDASRKGITLEVIEYQGFPRFVRGDQGRVRQAVSNIVANAISYTFNGGVQIECYLLENVEDRCDIEIAVQDTGVGMSTAKLDALFRELEQVEQVSDPLEASQEVEPASPNRLKAEKSALGLGLATVARVIKNMNGQLRLKSEENKGSRFIIQLPFTAPQTPPAIPDSASSTVHVSTADIRGPVSGSHENEVTLVKGMMSPADGRRSSKSLIRQVSNDSVKTTKSNKSGSSSRSEVDRLIDAIQSTSVSPTPDAPKAITMEKSPPSGSRGASMSPPQREIGPGQEQIEGSIAPLRAVKVGEQVPAQIIPRIETLPPDSSPAREPSVSGYSIGHEKPSNFNVLVAEDDIINSRIIKKRLEKLGHTVHLTVNGDECSTVFSSKPGDFDVVLMDIQMPIVDGFASTQRIRKTEESGHCPDRHKSNGRIPIFAVSASLLEDKRQEYIDIGFDGWILKPIDFKRLQNMMEGIIQMEVRNDAVYVHGEWEKGGWFKPRGEQPSTRASEPPPAISSEQNLNLAEPQSRGTSPIPVRPNTPQKSATGDNSILSAFRKERIFGIFSRFRRGPR